MVKKYYKWIIGIGFILLGFLFYQGVLKQDLQLVLINQTGKDISRVVIKLQDRVLEVEELPKDQRVSVSINLNNDSDLAIEVDGHLQFKGGYLAKGMKGTVMVNFLKERTLVSDFTEFGWW